MAMPAMHDPIITTIIKIVLLDGPDWCTVKEDVEGVLSGVVCVKIDVGPGIVINSGAVSLLERTLDGVVGELRKVFC